MLNCVIHIRETQIWMKDSFTFSPFVQSFLSCHLRKTFSDHPISICFYCFDSHLLPLLMNWPFIIYLFTHCVWIKYMSTLWRCGLYFVHGSFLRTWNSTWHVEAHRKHSSNNQVSGLPVDHLNCDYPNCFLNVRTHPQTGWVRISRGKPGTLPFHKFPSGSDGPQSLRTNFLELEK